MLIYQLDAYLFKDELSYWCDQNYSYVGAPFLHRTLLSFFLTSLNKRFREIGLSFQILFSPKFQWAGVGNGGLSLRNIADCLSVLGSKKINFYSLFKLSSVLIKRRRLSIFRVLFLYLQAKITRQSVGDRLRKAFKGPEDYYWALYGKILSANFTLPSAKTANSFSIDEGELEERLARNEGRIPFGGHACLRGSKKICLERFDFIFESV